MKNNIDLDTSFNPIEVSIQKVLSEPKTALIHFEGNVPAKYGCMVRFKIDIKSNGACIY